VAAEVDTTQAAAVEQVDFVRQLAQLVVVDHLKLLYLLLQLATRLLSVLAVPVPATLLLLEPLEPTVSFQQ
jgi:hypothetical protein